MSKLTEDSKTETASFDTGKDKVGRPAESDWDGDLLLDRIKTLVGFLSPEERMLVFLGCSGEFCADCGNRLNEKPCGCWNE